jgi:hypothetical protein
VAASGQRSAGCQTSDSRSGVSGLATNSVHRWILREIARARLSCADGSGGRVASRPNWFVRSGSSLQSGRWSVEGAELASPGERGLRRRAAG